MHLDRQTDGYTSLPQKWEVATETSQWNFLAHLSNPISKLDFSGLATTSRSSPITPCSRTVRNLRSSAKLLFGWWCTGCRSERRWSFVSRACRKEWRWPCWGQRTSGLLSHRTKASGNHSPCSRTHAPTQSTPSTVGDPSCSWVRSDEGI